MTKNYFNHIKKQFILLAAILLLVLLYAVYKIREHRVHFLQLQADIYMQDDLAGHIHRPHLQKRYLWEEHDSGYLVIRTNNLGFREDENTEVPKDSNTSRILITGDSHTDGAVNNSESFPNILEKKLNAESPTKKFEIINGGTGYYTFRNYSGFLKKYLFLKPDYFVICIYSGNDFLEAITEDTRNYQILWSLKRFWNRFRMRLFFKGPGISQGINQLFYFAAFPEMKKVALALAEKYLNEINQLCEQNNIRLIVIFLPTKYDVEAAHYYSEIKLSEDEFNINQKLLHQLAERLNAKDINYLDLTSVMKQRKEKFFWEADHHLNVKGHELAAKKLFNYFKILIYPTHSIALA